MLYRFKSAAASDVLMLEANGRHIVAIWGRTGEDSLRQGILLPEDMPEAIRALEGAMAAEEAQRAQAAQHAQEPREDHEEGRAPAGVSLRQRAAPLLDMVRRSAAAGKAITWGV